MANRISKQKELEMKKRKKRRRIIIILLLLLLIAAICIYLLTAEVFKIQEIVVEGNNRLTTEEVLELSEVKKGDNIFSTFEIVTKVKLKQNGYVEDVKLEKTYPNKLKIKLTEREKNYQLLTETNYYIYINEQGYILEGALERLELPVITGMEYTEAKLQDVKRLEENDLEKMENILHIQLEAEKIGIKDQIQQIDTKEEYILHLNNDSIIINLGNATDLSNRMFYVKAILQKESGNSGTIYVNGNLNEGFSPYFNAK